MPKNYQGDLEFNKSVGKDVEEYLSRYGVDTDRYLPVGAKVLLENDEPDSIKIICVDQEKSDKDKDFFVTILLDNVDEPLKILDLFKSIDATVIHSSYKLEDVVIQKNFSIDEDKQSNRDKME